MRAPTRMRRSEVATFMTTSETPSASSSLMERTLGSGDHKVVGKMWILSGLVFGLAGLVLRLLTALDQMGSNLFADQNQLVQFWSAGRDLLLFGGLVAIFVGLATFLLPLQVGAPSLAFARGAAAAYWVWLTATVFVIVGYLANGGPGWRTQ